jgi:hypothetical protein
MYIPNLYEYTLFNADNLHYSVLRNNCIDLYYNMLANYVKNKFNDSRDISVLVIMIKQECINNVPGLRYV